MYTISMASTRGIFYDCWLGGKFSFIWLPSADTLLSMVHMCTHAGAIPGMTRGALCRHGRWLTRHRMVRLHIGATLLP